MAKGDWAAGTRAANEMIQIVLDAEGRAIHAGIGYNIQSPAGRILSTSGGHTWGGPDQQPPEPWRSDLQRLVDELRRERDEVEGLG